MPHMKIGALVPLSPPGWVDAGRNLLAGLQLAADELGVELVIRDTAADPERAAAAVDELAALGVAAVAGEYHSVVARAVAMRADALGLPFLCSSAVLDALVEQPSDWVARLSPPQSRGWRHFAEFLLAAGHRRIAVAADPSVYWESGIRILQESLIVAEDADALLLLVGYPEPAESIVASARRAGRFIGAPAGQPEFAGWPGIPFLRYLPERLTPLGERVLAALGGTPSFVAFEGYDTILALVERLRTGAWSAVDGTRGRIEFSRANGIWQWAQAPVQIVDRDPARPARFRVLGPCPSSRPNG